MDWFVIFVGEVGGLYIGYYELERVWWFKGNVWVFIWNFIFRWCNSKGS